ncbi:MAG: phosphatase PAP2 family protein [Methylocystis sp.]
MAFTSDQLAKLTRDASSEPQTVAAATWGQRLFELDLAAVHLFSRTARSAIGKFLAVTISKLGNGWIYFILAPIVLIGLGWQGTHVAALAGLNAALLHMLYPLIKRRFGRKRPFQTDPRLPSLLRTLDDHSFPSGHAMTLTGVLAPIVIAWPAATLSAGLLLLSMAWSRIATAHHYPSDVAAGVALGAGLSYPLASGILAYW